jgi:hypothetical protein
MKKALRELISDNTGQISTMRVIALFVLLSILPVFIAHNILAMIEHKGFQDLGVNALAAIGLVITGKITQGFIEK